MRTPNLAQLRQRYQELRGTTRHYSPEVHVASFVLPRWINELVEGGRQ